MSQTKRSPENSAQKQTESDSVRQDKHVPESEAAYSLPDLGRFLDPRLKPAPGEVLALQRTVGNRAVERLLSRREDDPHEPEPVGVQPSPVQRHHDEEQPPALQRKQADARRVTGWAKLRTPGRGQIQRRDTQHSLAKIIDAGVTVSNARGNMGQLGHAMDVWVEIDAGRSPTMPAGARPNTVYGLELEYWEAVNVPADNQGATGVKPWNDIHGMKPEASTFSTAAAGADLTWRDAVAQAAAGTLTGRQRIGFRDLPGLFERPGRNVERTLQFRIVFNDGNTRREIFATQVLRITNGRMGYGAYRDSTGNSVESHGFGADDYQAGAVAEQQALAGEANRLQPAGVPGGGTIAGALPMEARSNVQTFVAEILQNTAAEYLDLERAAFVRLVAADRQRGAADDFANRIAPALMGDVEGGVAAGHFLVPTIPGTQRRQRALPGGGLLVALVTGNNVVRMYYTDNTTRNISLNGVPGLAGRNWSLDLRSFAEIPTETVQASVDILKAMTVPARTKDMPLDDDSTHLRKFTRQGAHYIVTAGKMTGPKIKRSQPVKVYDPEIRDVSGEWLKAQFGGTTGFVRASKLSGLRDKAAWERGQKAELSPTTGNLAMKTYFEKYLRDNGNSHLVFSQLVASYPAFEDSITEVYKQVHGEPQYLRMKLDRETAGHASVTDFTLSALIYDGDHASMISDVMATVRAHAGQGDMLESAYNQHIPPLGYDVPATLGQIVHAHFMKTFREQGSGFAVYNQLLADYPDFAYRLKPAYRLVHGEDQLQAMLRARQAADFAADVPDPTSAQNAGEYVNFLLHGPFTLTDFVPTAGAAAAKFDASYDPMNNHMEIVVRVAFQFIDNPFDPEDVTGEVPAFNRGFGRQTWTDPEKDAWKQSYATAATAAFSNAASTIRCVRPGWPGIEAKPRFIIREVALGNQHFLVKADKAVLTTDQGAKKLRGGGRSGAGTLPSGEAFVGLQEYDVYDKLRDPRLHTYLHAGEKMQNIAPAYELDRRRLDEALGQLGRIEFGADLGATRAAVRNLADALKRLEIPSSLASLHPIVIKGTTNGPRTDNWGTRAATFVQNQLTAQGVHHGIEIASEVGAFNGVLVTSKPVDPAIRDTYVTNWSRFTAAHEFGHMIGLIDEYYGAASEETVKEMISAGWLPPETRADHLKLDPPKKASEKAKQEGTIALLRRTGLESPDFAINAPGTDAFTSKDSPKTTSIMTGGFEVNQAHLISAWEALVTMTAGFLDEKYWKIS